MYSKSLLFITVCFSFLLFTGCGGGSSPKAPPEITSLQPDHGPPGTMVTVSGKNFIAKESAVDVLFDGVEADVESAGESQIKATVPEGATSGPVTLSINGQTVSGPGFTVEAKAPGISSIEPDSGTVGTEVTIMGMNFSAVASENSITFNGTTASVKSASKTELVTEVPQGATDGPVKVTVKQKSTTGPDFDVIMTGTMQVKIATSGPDQDADGYTVSVDGSQGTSVDATDTLYVPKLGKGAHSVQLAGMASNCSLTGSNPRNLDIAAGDTTSTTFEISCSEVLNNKIVFASNRDGDYELFTMNADGSSPQQLTFNSGVSDYLPDISYDGGRIAYVKGSQIHVMAADGSNDRTLTTSSDSVNYLPSWSPDGSKIVFMSNRGAGTDYDVYVMNDDGTNVVSITQNDSYDQYPSWSPGGDKIIFTSVRNGDTDLEIYWMNTDGTGVVQLTDNALTEQAPVWSPDGSKIAFRSAPVTTDSEIYIINADGTGLTQMTSNNSAERYPTWSPDGSQLAFMTYRDGNAEIYKINVDGSGLPVNLTANSALDAMPSWSPVQ